MDIKRFVVAVCGDTAEMKNLTSDAIEEILREEITARDCTGLSQAVVDVVDYDPLFIIGERP